MKFILSIKDTCKGFAVECREHETSIIDVLFTSLSKLMCDKYLQVTLLRLQANKNYNVNALYYPTQIIVEVPDGLYTFQRDNL